MDQVFLNKIPISKTLNSYIKLKKSEIENFYKEENFNKKDPITNWEKKNTLDC